MICKNCNFQIEEGDTFCPNCGCKYEEELVMQGSMQNSMQNSILNPTPHTLQDSIEPSEETQDPFTTQYDNREYFDDKSSYDNGVEVPLVPAKKKKRVGLVISIILAVLLLLAGSVAAFWKPLLFAVAPEKYMGLIVKNTMDELSEETVKISENVFGFELSPQKEFTAGVNLDYFNAYDDMNFDVKVANFPDDKKVLVKGNFETEDMSTPFEGFWDDEKIGASFAGTDKKFLTVPSKNFGKEFEDSKCVSDHVDGDAEKILSDLDLSYSNIVGLADKESDNSKALEKHVSENLQEFFEKSTIGKRESTKYSFENSSVKAKKITVDFETDDFFDFMINLVEDVRADEKLNESIGDKALKECINGLKDIKKETDNHEMQVEIIEYKGKIVSISFAGEVDEVDYWDNYNNKYKTTIKTGDKNDLLSSITVTYESEYDYSDEEDEYGEAYGSEGDSVDEVVFKSNWVTEDEKITISLTATNENSYTDVDGDDGGYDNTFSYEFELDFKKGKWSIDVEETDKWDGEEEYTNEQSYGGKCSKKNGFTFTVDEEWEDEDWYYTMSFDEWKESTYSDWLDDMFDTYREDYLSYVYRNRSNFYYTYDTYYDWYEVHGSVWDVPDYDFEDWLDDEGIYQDDDWDTYEEECYITETVDAFLKFEISLKPKADIKINSGKHVDIFKWDEDDFRQLGQDAQEEMSK